MPQKTLRPLKNSSPNWIPKPMETTTTDAMAAALADQKEALRHILIASYSLSPGTKNKVRALHTATALSVLVNGDPFQWQPLISLVEEVIAEEEG